MFVKNLTLVALSIGICATSVLAEDQSTFKQKNVEVQSQVVKMADIKWGKLNPARGDQSPGAADLWGDRTIDVPTGMLVKFQKGFSSPPHIHNITYRGIVIEGLMHNDDPNAESDWMPAGSFWTQPAGHNHITAANGQDNMIFLEIDSGPYLVKPSDQAFDNGEKSLNMHESNLVWLNKGDMKSLKGKAQITMLWGSNEDGKIGGTMIKLPANYDAELYVNAKEFKAVVINGDVSYSSKETKSALLEAGSYFGSTGKFEHDISTGSKGAMIYVRTNGTYKLTN